jgi:quaternary ammonium compound-resistance protein SugE
MDWIILIIAGLFEVAFASCLGKAQMSSGSAAAGWYTGFVVALTLSMVLLMKASKTLPIGILVFKEPANFLRIFFIITLIGSVIGLKAVSPH